MKKWAPKPKVSSHLILIIYDELQMFTAKLEIGKDKELVEDGLESLKRKYQNV